MYISFRLVSGFLFFFFSFYVLSSRWLRRVPEVRGNQKFYVLSSFPIAVPKLSCYDQVPARARRTRSLMKNRQQKVPRKRLIVSISHSLIQLSVEGGFKLLLYQTIVLWQKFFILEPFFEAFKTCFLGAISGKKAFKN